VDEDVFSAHQSLGSVPSMSPALKKEVGGKAVMRKETVKNIFL
jgi:hypothetical protein